jgi:hypothetical protein
MMRKIKKIEFTETEAGMLWRASEQYRKTIMKFGPIMEGLSPNEVESLKSGLGKLEEFLIQYCE